jgi:rubrerythrin
MAEGDRTMKVEDYKTIISLAVGEEIEAYEFYRGVSEQVQDSNLKAIFKELAAEEKRHQNSLEHFLSTTKPLCFNEKVDYKVSETVEKPRLSLDMNPSDAIALAMKNEEEAMNKYTKLANYSTDEEQKEVFMALARMEQGHKARLEDMCTNMAFPESW